MTPSTKHPMSEREEMLKLAEAELHSVRGQIINFVDSGGRDDEPIKVTNGDLCRWFDRLDIVSAHLRNHAPAATPLAGCIICANGNDLPDGEHCRACGREGSAVGLRAAVIKARGRQDPPTTPVEFAPSPQPDARMREAVEPFVRAAKIIVKRPQDYPGRVAMVGGLADANDLTVDHFTKLLAALSPDQSAGTSGEKCPFDITAVTDEMVEAAAKVVHPLAFETDEFGDYLVMPIARREAKKQAREILTAALCSVSRPNHSQQEKSND